jgi:arginine/lysine/ornithine decarboxylase
VTATEALAARTWDADRSFFLVNGSSSGSHTCLLAAVGPGDEVVVGRDLHKSLLVVPYPPGIPALAPGEVIDPEVVDHLLACRRALVHICGPGDPTLDRGGGGRRRLAAARTVRVWWMRHPWAGSGSAPPR